MDDVEFDLPDGWNGLDPDVWGEFCVWGSAEAPPDELTSARNFIELFRRLLLDLARGETIPKCRINFLLDDLACASVHFEWTETDARSLYERYIRGRTLDD